MGPQCSPWDSTFRSVVRVASRSSRTGAARSGRRWAHFPRDCDQDRLLGGQKPAGSGSCLRAVFSLRGWTAPGCRGTDRRLGNPLAARRVRLVWTVRSARRPLAAFVRGPTPDVLRVSGRFRRHPIRPVLKHGPRSLTCVRVTGWQTHGRNESKGRLASAQVGSQQRCWAHHRPVSISTSDEAEQEHTRWDPKDGELCLSRTKPEETLVEVRSDSDVQIDRQTWV